MDTAPSAAKSGTRAVLFFISAFPISYYLHRMMKYHDKLQNAIDEAHSCLCIGLDPHMDLFPEELNQEHPDDGDRVIYFLKRVIEVTHTYCAAYKPNLAFFEALGKRGFEIFDQVIGSIPDGKIIIADAKRGDIGSTAQSYRKAFFDYWDVDAITLNPLMGFETLEPYFSYPSKALYVLTLTSNPGAKDFFTKPFSKYDTMAEYIAGNLQLRQPQSDASLGMVVGATHPNQLSSLLESYPTAPLLIPGIGKQGGNIRELTEALAAHQGLPLISSSRSILFAGGNDTRWEQAVEATARRYRDNLMPITENYV